MTTSPLHFLILGAGSVGKRHMQNLKELNCIVSAMDPRADRLDDANEAIGIEHRFESIAEIDGQWRHLDGVVIGSPPAFHIDQALVALENKLPVLMEKPLCAELADAERLAAYLSKNPDRAMLLGYTYRWWPPLAAFKQRLADPEFGKVLHVKFVMSAHLADWHPWERYQDFFMASKEQGGGALLDESHFIDLMYWFFGMPKAVFANVEKLSDLEISSDDSVDVLARYDNDLRVYIHLDLYGRPHEKYIRVTGENKTLEWCFDPNEIRYSDQMAAEWQRQGFDYERNDMFINVAREFIELVQDNGTASCDIGDGVNVLKIIEACRESSHSRNEVTL